EPRNSGGTPEFLAPEQILARGTASRESDVWALGLTFFEILTGRLPYEQGANEPDDRFAARIANEGEPVLGIETAGRADEIPHTLAAVVMDCLRKRPAERPRARS